MEILEPTVHKLNSEPWHKNFVFPIQLKRMTDSETKEYHLKRLERLCLKFKNTGKKK